MSKLVYLMITAGLAAVAVAAIHINDVNARQQIEFIQVSVLAEHQADYEVDDQVIAIPAVSVDIIEDAAQDFQSQPSVRIITYTALPTQEPGPDREEQEGAEPLDEIKHDNGQGNGNQPENPVETGDNDNQSNNGDGGSNPNDGNGNNGNGNGNGNNGNGNGNGNNGNGNGNGNNGNGNGNGDGNGNVNSNGNGNGNGGDVGNDKEKETKPEKSE